MATASGSIVTSAGRYCVYGAPPAELAAVPAGAGQVSPLALDGQPLENLTPASLDGALVAAPPGAVERRYALAMLLRALKPGAVLTALAPKDKGGTRIGKELEAFGCVVAEQGKRHQRICQTRRPAAPAGLEAAIAAGALHYSETLGLWTQAGVFSWDRLDPGTAQLIEALPPLSGRGADLGCGLGLLARAVLASAKVTRVELVDLDRRAIEAARRNVEDPRARFHQADVRTPLETAALDFVVMNPPFHDGGREDRTLGEAFIRRAQQVLRPGGALWMVANRKLPYEAPLNELFKRLTPHGETSLYKVYEAVK
jgi:16S rRNA (guanine1207-N2)-methyltransferase